LYTNQEVDVDISCTNALTIKIGLRVKYWIQQANSDQNMLTDARTMSSIFNV